MSYECLSFLNVVFHSEIKFISVLLDNITHANPRGKSAGLHIL